MCDVLSPSARVDHAAYCITQMTWTILNLLTWPSIWVSMGTSQTTRDIEEVHAKVFKPMINYIHRTFHAPHLNLTEPWMFTIENVFLGCLKKKSSDVFQCLCCWASCFTTAVCCHCVFPEDSLQWLHGCMKLHLRSKNGWFIYLFSMLMLYLSVNLLCFH